VLLQQIKQNMAKINTNIDKKYMGGLENGTKRCCNTNEKVQLPTGKSCTYTALSMLVTQRNKQYNDYYINLGNYEKEKGDWRFR
jgi:hypothetical protein